jgi:phospholipid transport system substrate-binding protein
MQRTVTPDVDELPNRQANAMRPILAALAIVALGLGATPCRAAGADPAAVITSLVSGLARMSADPSLSAGDRERSFAALLQQDCNLPMVSSFVLGAYLRAASQADLEAFDRLFGRWIAQRFVGELGNFDARTLKVTKIDMANADATVASEIASDEQPVEIEWRLHRDAGQYRIVDVALEGISMALVEREEVGDVIRRNGGTVAGLNSALEARLDGPTASASALSRGP